MTSLVLPTAGTTGQPKLVPLTREMIDASVAAWASTLGLTKTDRCLNIMPIWHGGFISNVLASLSVGGSVTTVPPNPSPAQLFDLIREYWPTWLALPAPLAKRLLGEEVIFGYTNHSLRFVRLSKASLAAHQLAQLERIFNCPVLQSYGMTEAASGPVSTETLICRRFGSVGKPIHLDVKIGGSGQVLIRGPSLMTGYVSGPPAESVFTPDGWLMTGDLGHFDEDGFLYLTGRIGQ